MSSDTTECVLGGTGADQVGLCLCVLVPQLEFRRQLSRRTRAIFPTLPQARLHLGTSPYPGQALHQQVRSLRLRQASTRDQGLRRGSPLQASLATSSRGARPRLEGFFSLERASFKMFARLCPTKILTTSFLNLLPLLLRRGAPLGWVLHKVGD